MSWGGGGTNSYNHPCSWKLSGARLLGCLLPCGGGGGSHCQERRGEGTSSVGGQGRCVASDSPLVGARFQLLWGGGRGEFWLKCFWPGRGAEGMACPTAPLGAQTEPVLREVIIGKCRHRSAQNLFAG